MSRRRNKKRSTARRLGYIRDAFDKEALRRVCQMGEQSFAAYYGMEVTPVAQQAPHDWYAYKNNGANVLAVAHLDTVAAASDRVCRFVDTEAGKVVFSRALDDRLGAYIILELLPKLGITYDLLLTVGEECGSSTAAFFEPPDGKVYDWIIEFDRGGTDVVMYQYEDADLIQRVKATGARVAQGIFSDISYMEHLNTKAINWGVGYQDYHGPRSHAFLEDTFEMVDYYVDFHTDNEGTRLPHTEDVTWGRWGRQSWGRSSWDARWDEWADADAAAMEGEPDSLTKALAGLPDVDAPDTPDYNEYPSLEAMAAAQGWAVTTDD